MASSQQRKTFGVDSISSLDEVGDNAQFQQPPANFQDQPEESLESRLEKAIAFKNTAKPFVKGNLFEDAIKIYESAFYTLKPTARDRSSPDFKRSLELQTDLFNNLSYCYSQIERHQEAISYSKRVLLIDKDNVKALFRLATCYSSLGDYVAAYEEIEKCQEAFRHQNPDQPIDPKIKELSVTLKEKCKTVLEERERREREMYARMVGNQKPVQEVERTQKVTEIVPEPKRSIFSYKIVRFGIGLGITGLIGYVLYDRAKRRAEAAAREILPGLILAVGAFACLKYVKGNVRSSLFWLGMGIMATLLIQRANKNK